MLWSRLIVIKTGKNSFALAADDGCLFFNFVHHAEVPLVYCAFLIAILPASDGLPLDLDERPDAIHRIIDRLNLHNYVGGKAENKLIAEPDPLRVAHQSPVHVCQLTNRLFARLERPESSRKTIKTECVSEFSRNVHALNSLGFVPPLLLRHSLVLAPFVRDVCNGGGSNTDHPRTCGRDPICPATVLCTRQNPKDQPHPQQC